MNKEKFLVFFKKKSQRKDEPDGIQITNVLTSATENVTSVELYARDFGTASTSKKFPIKYPKYSSIRTTVNTRKKK